MKLSASQAAKKTGKSVPTITRAIKSGKISAQKTGSGGYQIDAAELFRVFKSVDDDPNVKGNMSPPDTLTNPGNNTLALRLLQEKVEVLEAALSDAKGERDEWRDQAKRLAVALPSPEVLSKPQKRRWWPWS